MTRRVKLHADFLLFALITGAFVYTAAQRLTDIPMPDSDEAMTLQVPYELLTRGKLAFPMYQYLGGNIQNVWHSFSPVFFAALAGFLKLFGWGLTQARAFNLITAALMLFLTYLIARRNFGWSAAVVTILLVVSDSVFFARSRLARNDMLAACFGLLAFYLYERAEEKNNRWYYLLSGIAAGAGVMCHTNLIYILVVILALMLMRHGWRLIKTSGTFIFGAGALAVMSYELVYDIIDYNNFVLQNRKDTVHFQVLEPLGWWTNLIAAPHRYAEWYQVRGVKYAPTPELLHLFLILFCLSFAYLLIRTLLRIRDWRKFSSEPRTHVLVSTLIIVLFFAIVTQRKVTQYVIHLAPWFALCVGIVVSDLREALRRIKVRPERWARPLYIGSISTAALLILIYATALYRQDRRYLVQIRNPELSTFNEVKAALKTIVPDELCPVSIGSAYTWLAFPEKDQCYFAYMEAPLDEPLNLDGKDYALIVRPRFLQRAKSLTGGVGRYYLLGRVENTAYGSFDIYYTGSDPRLLSRQRKRFFFFDWRRGFVTDDQIARAKEVWSVSKPLLTEAPSSSAAQQESTDDDERQDRGALFDVAELTLKPESTYYINARARGVSRWELLVLDSRGGQPIHRIAPREEDLADGVFKTWSEGGVRIVVRKFGSKSSDFALESVGIQEVLSSEF